MAFIQAGEFPLIDADIYLIKHIAYPSLYHADETLLRVLHAGFYRFGPLLLGNVLHWFGAQSSLLLILRVIQAACWGIQIAFFFLLAKALTKSDKASVLATLLFSWGAFLLKLPDAPTCPSAQFARALGFAFVMPSIYLYFTDKKWLAWTLAAVAFYIHGNPAVHLLELYALADAFEVLRKRDRAGAFLLRLATVAALLAPTVLSVARDAPIPSIYRPLAYISLQAYPPIPLYHLTDWILFFQGAAFILYAWRQYRRWPEARSLEAFFFASGCLIALAWLSRAVLYPLGLPFHELLMKVTSDYSYLFLLDLLGLVMLGRWLAGAFDAGSRRPFPWLVVVFALIASRRFDYILRFAALAIMLLPSDKPRARALAAAVALGVSSLAWAWQWKPEQLGPLLVRRLHLGGALFSLLPLFHKAGARGLLLCLLGAVALRAASVSRRWPVALALVFGLAAILRSDIPREGRDEAWERTADWVRSATPQDSLLLLPCDKSGPYQFPFAVRAERPVFASDTSYGVMLCVHGPAALPLVARLDDMGCDLRFGRTWAEAYAEDRRMCGALDQERILRLASKYGVTHVVAEDSSDPFRSFEAVYRDGPYRVYALAGKT